MFDGRMSLVDMQMSGKNDVSQFEHFGATARKAKCQQFDAESEGQGFA